MGEEMKRFQFLLAMFGVGAVAKAQTTVCGSSDGHPVTAGDCGKILRLRENRASWVAGASNDPVNNQCPVCGRMAAKYINPAICAGMDYKPVVCAPSQRITRCSYCNAAFWQDAV